MVFSPNQITVPPLGDLFIVVICMRAGFEIERPSFYHKFQLATLLSRGRDRKSRKFLWMLGLSFFGPLVVFGAYLL